jgi:hypothetical protein
VNSEKYIGLDVHQATISVAVMDSRGKIIMESILETKASTILEFFAGLRGTLLVTFEEGTWAAWLYDLLKPHVAKLVVCNPRKNALLKHGNKSDRIDARKLAKPGENYWWKVPSGALVFRLSPTFFALGVLVVTLISSVLVTYIGQVDAPVVTSLVILILLVLGFRLAFRILPPWVGKLTGDTVSLLLRLILGTGIKGRK